MQLFALVLGLFAVTSSGENSPLTVVQPLASVKDVVSDLKEVMEHLTIDDFNAMGWMEHKLLKKSKTTPVPRISDECNLALDILVADVYEYKYYALHMIDAMGKRQSGVKRGNYRWKGEYFECVASNPEHFKAAQWCYLVVSHAVDASGGQLGTCMPEECTEEEVGIVYQEILDDLLNNTYQLIVCCVLGILVIGGTTCEIVAIMQGYTKPVGDEIVLVEEAIPYAQRFFLSFSVMKNTKALFDTTQKEGNIHSIHGLRFLSMTWIMLGHCFLFVVSYADNLVDFAEYYETHGSFQAVIAAEFAVDTFFVIGGLLVAYLGFRELDKRGGLNIPMMYVGRFIRLTPAYALMILLSVSLYGKIGDGPTWPLTMYHFKHTCSRYWWTNLIYINNLYPAGLNQQCNGWTWYLGDDMQFYLLAPISILLLHSDAIKGLALLAFGLFSNILVTGVLSSVYRVQPDAVGLSQLSEALIDAAIAANESYSNQDQPVQHLSTTPPPDLPQSDFWSDIYAKPWCRIGVYIIGIATGYLLHITKNKLELHKYAVLAIWCLFAIVETTLIYGLYPSINNLDPPDIDTAAFYNCISRPLWGLGIAWIIVASVCGYAGPLNTLLTLKVFIPFSRLTYCAYLVHPLVITYMFAYRENEMDFEIPVLISYFAATMLLSYTVAYVFAMVIEVPMMGIMKLIFPKGPEKSKETSDGNELSASSTATKDTGAVNINYVNGDSEMVIKTDQSSTVA